MSSNKKSNSNTKIDIKRSNIDQILSQLENNKSKIDYNSYMVRTSFSGKNNEEFEGKFLIAHKDDIDKDKSLLLSIKNTNQYILNLRKAFKSTIIILIISILLHDVYQYYRRYLSSKVVDYQSCLREYKLNSCNEVINDSLSAPYLLEKCYSIKICLEKNYFMVSNFIIESLTYHFNFSFINDFSLEVLNQSFTIAFVVILAGLVVYYI